MFEQGLDIEAIATERSLKPTTIWTHLADAMLQGQAVEIDRLISPERQIPIRNAIAQLGMDALKPIFDHLEGVYSYGEIRVMCAAIGNESRSESGIKFDP